LKQLPSEQLESMAAEWQKTKEGWKRSRSAA